MKQLQVCMSKRESYLGGHSIFAIKKKNKSKATTGSIIKSKRRWLLIQVNLTQHHENIFTIS